MDAINEIVEKAKEMFELTCIYRREAREPLCKSVTRLNSAILLLRDVLEYLADSKQQAVVIEKVEKTIGDITMYRDSVTDERFKSAQSD